MIRGLYEYFYELLKITFFLFLKMWNFFLNKLGYKT